MVEEAFGLDFLVVSVHSPFKNDIYVVSTVHWVRRDTIYTFIQIAMISFSGFNITLVKLI